MLLTGKIPPAEPGDDLRQAQPRVLGPGVTEQAQLATVNTVTCVVVQRAAAQDLV